ncbi:hypothetical protein Taro_024500 [Colocasia esculenta]|uniref:Uncharacterized protein n=1 Tax=Colocasia esculenta TaxID=4460 RepID=A0A843V0I5_COLES|nr:hypothetical protein [Colocasia esculenta]
MQSEVEEGHVFPSRSPLLQCSKLAAHDPNLWWGRATMAILSGNPVPVDSFTGGRSGNIMFERQEYDYREDIIFLKLRQSRPRPLKGVDPDYARMFRVDPGTLKESTSIQ